MWQMKKSAITVKNSFHTTAGINDQTTEVFSSKITAWKNQNFIFLWKKPKLHIIKELKYCINVTVHKCVWIKYIKTFKSANFFQKITTLPYYFRAKGKIISSETKNAGRDNISKLLGLLCISKSTRCVIQPGESRLHKATFVPYCSRSRTTHYEKKFCGGLHKLHQLVPTCLGTMLLLRISKVQWSHHL